MTPSPTHTHTPVIPPPRVRAPTAQVILLGDSAVGKSKLVERFLMDGFAPQQLSTYALTLFRYNYKVPGDADPTADGALTGKTVPVDIWDTAGQERFSTLHPSYFYKAHACIMVFDVTRKATYKHLERWHQALQEYAPDIPTFVVANKVDVDYSVTQRSFAWPTKHRLPFFFVSAADGTNVVKAFHAAVAAGLRRKECPPEDVYNDILNLLEEDQLGEGTRGNVSLIGSA